MHTRTTDYITYALQVTNEWTQCMCLHQSLHRKMNWWTELTCRIHSLSSRLLKNDSLESVHVALGAHARSNLLKEALVCRMSANSTGTSSQFSMESSLKPWKSQSSVNVMLCAGLKSGLLGKMFSLNLLLFQDKNHDHKRNKMWLTLAVSKCLECHRELMTKF